MNGGRFEKKQLLLVDDTALVAESEKLCRLVMSLVEYAKRTKLRVNVGKKKVMRCSRNENL